MSFTVVTAAAAPKEPIAFVSYLQARWLYPADVHFHTVLPAQAMGMLSWGLTGG